MKPPQADFSKAVAAFGAKDYSRAKALCSRLLRKNQLVADCAHLLALIYKAEGSFDQAEELFKRSLAANAGQSVVLSNFANLKVQLKRLDEADELYSRSTRADPGQADAWRNWASTLISMERFSDALEKAKQAVSLNTDDPQSHILLGHALRQLEDYQAAIAALDRAISLSPAASRTAIHAQRELAVTYRAMNRPEKATALLTGILETGVRLPELYFLKACAHYDAGEFDFTEREMIRAIELRPDYVDAHEALSKLYWESGQDEKFLSSYEAGLLRAPASRELRYSLVKQLMNANREDAAREVLNKAVREIGPDPDFIHALGVLSLRESNFDEAEKFLDQALLLVPDAPRFRIDRANLAIRRQEYREALEHLEHAGRMDSLDQEVWAYKGLCWRLTGDSRADWLNDYDRLVRASYLDAPEGYNNLEHFMHELAAYLESLHKTQRQPLDQSVRNGSQTVGRLFSDQSKVIQDYRLVLGKSIQNYVDNLPSDPTHPFLARVKKEFVHSGSWSVKLHAGGFHSNHMHPRGWLSSCAYVSLPPIIREDDASRAGWIKFGETSLNLGPTEQVGKAVCPVVGMQVLFPSFMWHGTYPFESEQCRITIPSDISPGQ